MTSRVARLIKEKGDAIKCEAEIGKDDGHSGLIVLVENGSREILGRTDPTFRSAEVAVAAMEDAVATIQKSIPEPTVVEEPEKVETEKKKPRKTKGGDV